MSDKNKMSDENKTEPAKPRLPQGYVTLARDVPAILIPDGVAITANQGLLVRITQTLGHTFTVMSERGQLMRIDNQDADALGIAPLEAPGAPHEDAAKPLPERVMDALKTCYDPEIPVNIVDLGLIYGCEVTPADDGRARVDIKMTLTAPGCGMSEVLKKDVESKLSRLAGVGEAHVDVVFEPPWTQERMSEAARLQLNMY